MIMDLGDTKKKIDGEMQKAFDSRSDGNEGRARVCARRAAGFAIGPYFQIQTGETEPSSAYDLLRWLADRNEISYEVREAARRLTVQVTPDHNLPHPEDPLNDAKEIIATISELEVGAQVMEATSLKFGKAGELTYLLRIPKRKPSTWIIMLHGLGGNEESMWALETALPQDALILSLRGLFPLGHDSYSWVNPSINGWPTVVDFAPAIDALEEMVEELEIEENFERDQLMLMGFSQGAALAFAASTKLAPRGLIAAAGFLPKGDLAGVAGLPVFWGHGTLDEWVPITRARDGAERLHQLGAQIDFCESEVKHKLGLECLQGLKKWFKIQRAEPRSD
jgi:phospholipase/carboxylesterase